MDRPLSQNSDQLLARRKQIADQVRLGQVADAIKFFADLVTTLEGSEKVKDLVNANDEGYFRLYWQKTFNVTLTDEDLTALKLEFWHRLRPQVVSDVQPKPQALPPLPALSIPDPDALRLPTNRAAKMIHAKASERGRSSRLLMGAAGILAVLLVGGIGASLVNLNHSYPGIEAALQATSTATNTMIVQASPTGILEIVKPTEIPTQTSTDTPATSTPTQTSTPTSTASNTPTSTNTPSVTPTGTDTATLTYTPTPTWIPSSTPTASVTPPPTDLPSQTPTDLPTIMASPTSTIPRPDPTDEDFEEEPVRMTGEPPPKQGGDAVTVTARPPRITLVAPQNTATYTPTPSATSTEVIPASATPTDTATNPPPATNTPDPTATKTIVPPSPTLTGTNTIVPSFTPSPTGTPTDLPTLTQQPSATLIQDATATLSNSVGEVLPITYIDGRPTLDPPDPQAFTGVATLESNPNASLNYITAAQASPAQIPVWGGEIPSRFTFKGDGTLTMRNLLTIMGSDWCEILRQAVIKDKAFTNTDYLPAGWFETADAGTDIVIIRPDGGYRSDEEKEAAKRVYSPFNAKVVGVGKFEGDGLGPNVVILRSIDPIGEVTDEQGNARPIFLYSTFGHMKAVATDVDYGDVITAGTQLGVMGAEGTNATGEHVDFMMFAGDENVIELDFETDTYSFAKTSRDADLLVMNPDETIITGKLLEQVASGELARQQPAPTPTTAATPTLPVSTNQGGSPGELSLTATATDGQNGVAPDSTDSLLSQAALTELADHFNAMLASESSVNLTKLDQGDWTVDDIKVSTGADVEDLYVTYPSAAWVGFGGGGFTAGERAGERTVLEVEKSLGVAIRDRLLAAIADSPDQNKVRFNLFSPAYAYLNQGALSEDSSRLLDAFLSYTGPERVMITLYDPNADSGIEGETGRFIHLARYGSTYAEITFIGTGVNIHPFKSPSEVRDFVTASGSPYILVHTGTAKALGEVE
jgi:hypothetical protein